MTTRPVRPLLAAVAVLGALAACGGSSGDAAPAGDEGDGPEGAVTVFAAASLTDAFADVAAAFEDEHPGVTVELSFAGSPSLREQVLEGAPADVVATADEGVMADLVDEGAVGEPVAFATNRLQLAVPAGNPAGVGGLDDLGRGDLVIGLCAAGVPCGDLARRVLDGAGVEPAPDTEEPNVRALLAKSRPASSTPGSSTPPTGAAGDAVKGVDVPAGEEGTRYPIITVAGAPHPRRDAFVARTTPMPGRPRRPRVRPAVNRAAPAPTAGRPPPQGYLVPLAALQSASSSCPWWRCCSRPPGPTCRAGAPSSPTPCGSAWSRRRATGLSLLGGVPLPGSSRGPACPACRCPALATLPVVLPPVVGGAALLFAFGRRGLVGEPLEDATGFVLPFSIWGVIAANTFVALPFLVLTVESGLRAVDARYEEAAATLGAGRWTVLRRVTLPQAAPSIVAGAVLCFARALGEFGATVTFAGNLQGRTQTMPLAVFVALESDRDAAVALSLVLVAVSLAVLVPLRDRWLRA